MTEPGRASERRLEAAAELAVRIAAGDLTARSPVSERGDAVDAVVLALNLLAEELQNERASRQRAEELLLDEVMAYETAPALFCSLDGATLGVESCNQTLAQALGLSKGEIVGRSVLELYSTECRDPAERWLRGVALGTSSDGGEASLCQAAGGYAIVSQGASRIEGSDGRERLRVVFRDVTAERKLEAQLAQAQKLEAIGRLSGGVAHDFNNILSVITGAAALLGDLLAAHGLESEDVVLIQEAVARGASLTRDLLAFSRRRVSKPVSTDIRSVVFEAQRMIERLVGEHIAVTSDLPADPVLVLIDPSQLSQVLINLAINSRDAMPGGGRLHMSVCRMAELGSDPELLDLAAGSYVKVVVADTGAGMTADVRARAFEPFFTTKGAGKGSGLGLSVCYGIVRQADGRILLRSEPSRGTTVEIVLPAAAGVSGVRTRPSTAAPPRGRESVLVVEDDHAVCMVTRRVLESAGYHVIAAQNGKAALAAIDQARGELDALVTDVTMPGMSGLELARELRAGRPRLVVLFLSGYTESLGGAEGELDWGTDFLGKPYTSSALLAKLRRLLDRAGQAELGPGTLRSPKGNGLPREAAPDGAHPLSSEAGSRSA